MVTPLFPGRIFRWVVGPTRTKLLTFSKQMVSVTVTVTATPTANLLTPSPPTPLLPINQHETLGFIPPLHPVRDDRLAVRKHLREKAVTEYLGVHPREVIRVTGLRIHQDFLSLKELFGEKEEVVVGFYPEGHVYLMVGGIRYDGEPFTRTGSLKMGTHMADTGILLRFKNLPRSSVNQLRRHLAAQAGVRLRSWTCASGVCAQLKEGAGIEVRPGLTLRPSTLLKSMVQDGATDSRGKSVRMEVYLTDDESLAETYHAMRLGELSVLVPGYQVVAVLVVGGSIAWVITEIRAEDARERELRKGR